MIAKEGLEMLGKGVLALYVIVVIVCVMVWSGTPEILPAWIFVALSVVLPLSWLMGFMVEMVEDIAKY